MLVPWTNTATGPVVVASVADRERASGAGNPPARAGAVRTSTAAASTATSSGMERRIRVLRSPGITLVYTRISAVATVV